MLNQNAQERVDGLENEKQALKNLVDTLTAQNREILDELENHMQTNDRVRRQLDRKEQVGSMLDVFNRDLLESKRQVENASPQRFMRQAQLTEQTVQFSNYSKRRY